MEGWVFLTIHRRYSKKDAKEIVANEIRSIVGQDLLDFEIPELSEFEDSEGYLFLKCGDYSSHKRDIANSRIFTGVIPNYENPHFQSDEDIEAFRKSVEMSERPVTLTPGCCVEIKGGYYKGLFGLIADILPNNKYKVLFKLYTIKKHEVFKSSNLVFVKNIFDKVKNPVLDTEETRELRNLPVPNDIETYMENYRKIVGINKIYWTGN